MDYFIDSNGDLAMGDLPPDGVALSGSELAGATKKSKLKKIASERDAACFADVTAFGRPWQADIRSQQMLASAILLAQAGVYTPTLWRDSNNEDMAITSLAQLVAIAGAIAAQTQMAYSASWSRKAALESALSTEEIEAI